MSVELPARIAILGAGPIGLETALYARYLGYDVDVYERGRVAEHLLRWGHAPLFTPFGAVASPLGMKALVAQDAGWRPPAEDALLTAGEIVERYYEPLAQSDLLIDQIHLGVEALAISRGPLHKGELSGEERATADFRLLMARTTADNPDGAPGEQIATADVVIDVTGNYAQHNWLGPGGIPALGELGAQDHIEYGLPDILGRDRADYAHRHTLFIGSGHTAAAGAVALAQLGHEAPYTRFTWIVRRDLEGKFDPIRHIENDPWPARDRLATMANQLIQGELGHLAFYPATSVEEVVWQGGLEQFHVRLGGKHAEELAVDRIIAGVGHRGDNSLYAELQVSDDPRRGAPQGCSHAIDSQASFEEALSPEATGLITGEPDFYVLGAKSFGRDSRFTIPDGLEQIRLLFTILGGRADLNLYRTSK